MLQQQISRKISALIDWSACYISQTYSKHQQDHQTIALFKTILINIDPIHFKPLSRKPSTIKELQLNINQYFKMKFRETKQTVLQGGNLESSNMKVLVMFQLLLQLAYISTKQKCLTSISSLDDQSKRAINKLLEEIIRQRGNKPSQSAITFSSENQTIKRLREQNRRLKITIESLRVNESLLIQKNVELEARFRQFEYENLRRVSDIQQAKRRIQTLQGIIKEISMEIYNDENFNDSNLVEVKHSSVLDNCKLVKSMNSQKQLEQQINILDDSSEAQLEEVIENNKNNQKQIEDTSNHNNEDDWYVKKLEKQFQKSKEISRRFNLLKEMHEKLKTEVAEILN